jgi:hypothetical protein
MAEALIHFMSLRESHGELAPEKWTPRDTLKAATSACPGSARPRMQLEFSVSAQLRDVGDAP